MRRRDVAFADASVFMGMHSPRESIRIACKNFFVGQIGGHLAMTLDQIGLCDDIVWRYPRHIQDTYYPFMDQLHTWLAAERVSYSHDDIRRAGEDPSLSGLDAPSALMLAHVCNEGGALWTINPVLLERTDLPVVQVQHSPEARFPEPIESAYRASRLLQVDTPFLGKKRSVCRAG